MSTNEQTPRSDGAGTTAPDQTTKSPPLPPIPDADDWRWQREADDLRHSELTNVRKSASGWAGTIAGLLGAFSAVSIVAGPESITDISNQNLQFFILILVIAAAVLAVLAIRWASFAAQGAPQVVDDLNGPTLRTWTLRRAKEAAEQLAHSRNAAVIAALLVIAGALLARLDAVNAKPDQPIALAVTKSGAVLCGKLTRGADGQAMLDGKALSNVSSVSIVERCPTP